MRSGRRLPVRRVTCVAVAALVVGAALAVAGPASAAAPKVYSARYSGTLEIRFVAPPFHTPTSETYTYRLAWSEHATAPPGQTGTWTIDSLKGSVSDHTAGGGSPVNCLATLASSGAQTLSGGIVDQGDHYVVIPPSGSIPWGLAVASPPSDPACQSVPRDVMGYFATDQSVLKAWAAAERPMVTFPAKGSHTHPLNFTWHCPEKNPKGCQGTVSYTVTGAKAQWAGTIDVVLESRLDFASPGFKLGSPPTVDPKATARADLGLDLSRAAAPCVGLTLVLGAQAGLTIFGLASPIPSTAAGLVKDAAVDITADALSGPLTTICAEALRRIAVDYAVIKHDPPLPEAAPPLKLPSCTRWQGKTRAYCRKLDAEATKLDAAERAVLPALKRLQSAGTALRKARAKHDAKGTASAEAQVKTAADAVTAARAAARAAGKSVADTVRAAGVQATLTRKQADAATAAMLARLAKQGVPTAELRKIAGSALTSAPTDLLAAIAT
jgi:hypothetical protein